MSKRDLRAIAESKVRRPGYRSRMELFINSLDADDRASVDALLFDPPLLPHRAVADTLSDEFADNPHIAKSKVTDDEVLRWRAKHAT